jgi:hypothetical protein
MLARRREHLVRDHEVDATSLLLGVEHAEDQAPLDQVAESRLDGPRNCTVVMAPAEPDDSPREQVDFLAPSRPHQHGESPAPPFSKPCPGCVVLDMLQDALSNCFYQLSAQRTGLDRELPGSGDP